MKFASSMLFFAFLALTGCAATAPKEIGYGQYLHMRTPSGNVFSQGWMANFYECESAVRGSWAQLTSQGLTPGCSTVDMSKELPYRIHTDSSIYPFTPLEMRHRTKEACENAAGISRATPGMSITAYCSSPS